MSIRPPVTSARFAATLLSSPGNTSSRPSPRSRITAAVHGPMPLMSLSRPQERLLRPERWRQGHAFEFDP